MRNFEVIGLAGTNGSGKDTVGKILADHGYLFLPLTDLMREEARLCGIKPSRENLRIISGEWRKESGLGVLVVKGMAQYEEVKDQYKGVVMSSMRNPGEADEIHKNKGTMVWVDADPRVRYERIQANAATRGRGAEDNISFEEFLADEQVEMHQASSDETTLSLSAVRDRCDIFIRDDSNNITELRRNVEKALSLD
jgi:dephospho-CoA kinase